MRQRVRWAVLLRAHVAAHRDALCAAVEADIGKPAWEAMTQELFPLSAALQWHARRAPALLASRPVGGRPWWLLGQRHWAYRVPAGHVLILATWNYPLQLMGIQLVQAVMAGNRVTVKPSERSPRSQALLLQLAVQAAQEAGMHAGQITAAEATREAGAALLRAQRFDHVLFTGSTRVGRQVAAVCAEALTPCTLELSGADTAIVLADAPMQQAARSIWHALSMNAGQTCMAPRRVLVERSALGRFLAEIRPLAAAAKPVHLADAAMAHTCAALVRSAVDAGGHPLSGVAEPALGDALRPQAVVDCPRNHELCRGEHFGPVLAILGVQELEEAVAVHRAGGQHLATSLYTCHPDRVLRNGRLLHQLGSSVVTINDTVLPTGHPGVPIEGRGLSGWGPSRGEAGLLALTRQVVVSRTSLRLRTPLDTPAAGVQRWLARLSLGRADARAAGGMTEQGALPAVLAPQQASKASEAKEVAP